MGDKSPKKDVKVPKKDIKEERKEKQDKQALQEKRLCIALLIEAIMNAVVYF